MVKAFPYNVGDPGSISGWGRSLEKEMAAHSSTLAWKIPWTEEPDRLRPWGRKESETTEQFHFRKNVRFGAHDTRSCAWH